jgi:membrane protease YdiL (CAAX protease family)
MNAPAGILPWGRTATFGFGLLTLLGGQLAALAALTLCYGKSVAQMPDLTGDGAAVSIVILASAPVQMLLLTAFAWIKGASATDYLGLRWPRRSDLIFGVCATIGLIVAGDALSWVIGRDIVTPFQSDIYRTAAASGVLPLLWFAVVVVTPLGEEMLFRGFLFRGWLLAQRDVWPVIVITALLWAIMHLQYDWYVIGQVFVSGLLLSGLRWASGSTILTIMLHGLINFEGMLESVAAFHA